MSGIPPECHDSDPLIGRQVDVLVREEPDEEDEEEDEPDEEDDDNEEDDDDCKDDGYSE